MLDRATIIRLLMPEHLTVGCLFRRSVRFCTVVQDHCGIYRSFVVRALRHNVRLWAGDSLECFGVTMSRCEDLRRKQTRSISAVSVVSQKLQS